MEERRETELKHGQRQKQEKLLELILCILYTKQTKGVILPSVGIKFFCRWQVREPRFSVVQIRQN